MNENKETAGHKWQADQHKAAASKHPVGSKQYHAAMAAHHESMGEYHASNGHDNLAAKADDRADFHNSKAHDIKESAVTLRKFSEFVTEASDGRNVFHGKGKNIWGGVGTDGHEKAKRKIKKLEKEGFKHTGSTKEVTGQMYSNRADNPLHAHTHTYKHPDGRTATHEHLEAFSGNSDIHNVKIHGAKS